jgi:hypothetical protein
MKAITLILVIIMFAGQISLGTVNNNGCPDTSNRELTTSMMQAEIEMLKSESDAIEIVVPSLQTLVNSKLSGIHSLLDHIQLETEGFEMLLSPSFKASMQKHFDMPQHSVKLINR